MLWINRSLIDQSEKASIAGPRILYYIISGSSQVNVMTDHHILRAPVPMARCRRPFINKIRWDFSAGAVRMTSRIYCQSQCFRGKFQLEFSAGALKMTVNNRSRWKVYFKICKAQCQTEDCWIIGCLHWFLEVCLEC